MILPCPGCGAALEWTLHRIGSQPMMATKCRHCDPSGPWQHEPVEIIVKPKGKRPDHIPQPPD